MVVDEVAARSGGMVRLHIVDPQTFSEDEDRAAARKLVGDGQADQARADDDDRRAGFTLHPGTFDARRLSAYPESPPDDRIRAASMMEATH